MLINYLRIALRNIRRNPLFSIINIGGLAIGIAVCMTILLIPFMNTATIGSTLMRGGFFGLRYHKNGEGG